MTTSPTPDKTVTLNVDLAMDDAWDSAAISDLIRSKSSFGETPAFLFLGRHEASLLRAHLGAAFGEESVASFKDLYYMGLEVVEIDKDHFIKAAGRKVIRTLQDPISRRPAWRDRDADSLWSFRLS